VARTQNARRRVGISGCLWAASNHPPRGLSHEPLLFAVVESEAAHLFAKVVLNRSFPSVLGDSF
jgi:hypothetical protein